MWSKTLLRAYCCIAIMQKFFIFDYFIILFHCVLLHFIPNYIALFHVILWYMVSYDIILLSFSCVIIHHIVILQYISLLFMISYYTVSY